MSATDAVGHGYADVDPYLLGHGGGHGSGQAVATGRGAGGPASKTVVVAYGFWLFLLSDIVLFSCLFAAHAVLQTAIADGPAGHELFQTDQHRDRNRVPTAVELHLRHVGGGVRGA
jgi:cytochrome o ubiquinol oxidase subunit III